jgi:hypothetical protein
MDADCIPNAAPVELQCFSEVRLAKSSEHEPRSCQAPRRARPGFSLSRSEMPETALEYCGASTLGGNLVNQDICCETGGLQ